MRDALQKNDGTKALYERVKKKLESGLAEQDNLLTKVSTMVIRDKLVAPAAMHFEVSDTSHDLRVFYGANYKEMFSVHRHALTQLSQKIGLPVGYGAALQSRSERWKTALLAEILNQSYANTDFEPKKAKEGGGNARFLHRLVGDELRGFLSRKFNRRIASAPLLRSFVETCAQVGAFPFDATATDVKVALKCMLPHVYEPVPGQFVCVGVEWTNSDFGAGRMQVALSLWMPTQDRSVVLDHVVSRVHIGSVIEESDIELSEETATKDAEAQASATKDAVNAQLAPDSVDKLLDAIEAASAQKIPWEKLKGQLPRFLSKQDLASLQKALEEDSTDLPPVVRDANLQPIPTKWWASSALSWLAGTTKDPERKLDLQHAAGGFLEVS